jgi:hypothetical protein
MDSYPDLKHAHPFYPLLNYLNYNFGLAAILLCKSF